MNNLRRSDVVSTKPGRCRHEWKEVDARASLVVVVRTFECTVCHKSKTRRDWAD